jgi:hypothetical protein
MAFQMTITLPSGIKVENAYVKIVDQKGVKNVKLKLIAYKDRESMLNGFPAIDGYDISYDFNPEFGENKGDNITQGYGYLKTLPEFKDAIDILEDGQAA